MKHLTEHQVAGFLDRALPPEERRLVEEHLEACADCRREMVTMSRTLADLPKGNRMRVSPWWIPAAVAAALVAVLLVPRSWVHTGPPPSGLPPATVRTPAVDGEREALIPIVAPRDDVTTRAPVVFTWRRVPADLYHVSLLANDGQPIWNVEVTDTSAALPAGVALQADHIYFWRVDAVANGIVASSGIHRLTIGP